MKVVVAGILTVLAGIAVGGLVAWYDLGRYSEHFDDDESLTKKATTEIQERQPKVAVLNGSEFNFGVMERHGKRSHRFEIKNIGQAPLSLKKGETTCKCTMNKLEDGVLLPGQTVDVELEWVAKEVGPDMVFMQSADIITNDPLNKVLRLTIRGDIISTIEVSPSPLVMSSILASRGAEGEVVIYSQKTDDLAFKETEIKVDPKLKGLIETVLEPLSAAELATNKHARSGKKLKIILKPGLPLGHLDQTVWLKTNLQDSPLVPVHFQGNVVRDISVFGKKFNRTTNRLSLGQISRRDGFRTELRILVRGEHRKTTQLQEIVVDPPGVFDVKVRASADASTGKTVQHVLDIVLLKEAPVISRLGSNQGQFGQILINTNHPKEKTIAIAVAFEISD